jgi:hypothetical protein
MRKKALLILFGFACASGQDIDTYMDDRIEELIAGRLAQKNASGQTNAVSLSHGSTDFVDQSAPADFVSMAVNLAGVGQNQNPGNNQAAVASSTLYALYAGARRKDPLEPGFYRAHSDLRRISFSLGQEEGVADNADLKSRATLVGTKVMLINRRDVVTLLKDKQQMEGLKKALAALGSGRNRIQKRLMTLVESRLAPNATPSELAEFRKEFLSDVGPKLKLLSESDVAEIDRIFEDEVEKQAAASLAILDVYEVFKRKPQMSVEFQTAQRPGSEADLYRSQLIFDYGLLDRVSTTLNGGFEYTDVMRVGADRRGGRVAGELRFQLTPDEALVLRNPLFVSVAGEGKWLTNTDTIYRVQMKFSFPLAQGLELPVSFGYANKTELLNEVGVYGKFGLTVDLAKLLAGLR